MKPAPLAVLAIAVGVANGLVFLGFEWIVNHGDEWLWNDAGDSDAVRWHVIPLAIGFSIVFSLVLRAVGQPRWTQPHVDPLASSHDDEPAAAPAFSGLVIILLIGATSLLAGASLGPEAPLFATAAGLGAWLTARRRLGPFGAAVTLASVGALLAAFFGSLIALAIPLLILRKRTGKLPLPAVAMIVLAGLAAYGTLWLVEGDADGYGGIPSISVRPRDYIAAVVLGATAVGLGMLLRWFIKRLATVTQRIDGAMPWWLAATVFGGVLGGLYLLGGPTVEFSGSAGSSMLLGGDVHYATWALAGLALVKLLATSWSLAAGYRGGLVFPSVFAGVALSLFFAAALPDFAGPGVLLGSIAGLLVEMTAPALGAVMLLALLPLKLLPLGLAGAAAAVFTRRFVTRG